MITPIQKRNNIAHLQDYWFSMDIQLNSQSITTVGLVSAHLLDAISDAIPDDGSDMVSLTRSAAKAWIC